MAISKEQPMRSAEIKLVDIVNGLSNDATTMSAEIESIDSRIGDGFTSDLTIAEAIQALRNSNDSIDAIIGTGLFSETNTITDVVSILENVRIGMTDTIAVPGNASQSTSAVFTTPFDTDSKCVVLGNVVSDELLSLFELTIVECTYSGFSYSVFNSDADEHSVNVGYIAIKVG